VITKRLLVAIALCLASASLLVAQCSDAGVCSIGSSNPLRRHEVNLQYRYGASGTPDNLVYHSMHAGGKIYLSESFQLSATIPWVRINGPLGTASGIGDLLLLFSTPLFTFDDTQLTLQWGGRIATGATREGSLPQSYQPGLGTNDLLLGLSYDLPSVIIAAGYQLSRGKSRHSSQLSRGDDLLLKIAYHRSIGDASASIETMAIHRLHESIMLVSDPAGARRRSIAGSAQTQINFLGSLSYPIAQSFGLEAQIALPLLQRDVNVDGLKRAFSFSIGISIFPSS
jgi:hypothetical protein